MKLPFQSELARLDYEYTGKLHTLIMIWALTILPFVLLAVVWTIQNDYPFGNHDAGFHYAQAMRDRSLFENYFGPSPDSYYYGYAPVSGFVLNVMMRFLPFSSALNFTVSLLIIITGFMWLFHYYTKSDLATFVLFTSSFLVGYYSTAARMVFLILLFGALASEKYGKYLSALVPFTHLNGFFWAFGSSVGSAVLDWQKTHMTLAVKIFTAFVMLNGILFRQMDLCWFPFAMVGWLFIDRLNNFEKWLLLTAAFGFYTLDTTIAMFMTVLFAVAIGREFQMNLPLRRAFLPFTAVFALILTASYFLDFWSISVSFLAISAVKMGFNYRMAHI